LASRSFYGGSATYQGNQEVIIRGYGSAIGIGDLVKRGAQGSGFQGGIVLATLNDTDILGVFAGIINTGYYDTNAQTTLYGLNGSYIASASPPAGVNIGCYVYEDPGVVFRAQVSGGPATQSWIGQNINFLAGTNGAPNAAGISTLALDATTLGTSPTLPFRIIGLAGVVGGPQDPTNTNPWVEVRLNTPEATSPGGI
jgi:hypothetical protein